jgi:hypothetical protein
MVAAGFCCMLSKSFHSQLPAIDQVRFGEFLLERKLISDEQWLAALADHWSNRGKRFGATIVANGFLGSAVVESQARVFHEDAAADFDIDICEEVEDLKDLLSAWSFTQAPEDS